MPLLAVVCLAGASLAANPLPEQASVASVQNHAVRVVYHLDTGSFDVVSVPSGRMMVAGAHAEVGPWKTTDAKWVRSAEVSRVTDDLGSAQRLVVRCAGPGGPTLISEFDVYGEEDPR